MDFKRIKKKTDMHKKNADKAKNSKDWNGFVKEWEAALSETKNSSPVYVYTELADGYNKLGRHKEAEKIAEKGLHHFPENPSLLVKFAAALMKQAKWKEAEQVWSALSLKLKNETPAQVWIKLVQTLRRQERLHEAEKTAQTGLKNYPEEQNLLLEAAKLASANNNWKDASKYWRKIFNVSTDLSEDMYARAVKALRLGGDPKEAEKIGLKGIDNHKENPFLNSELAEIAQDKKDWPAALKYWGRVTLLLESTQNSQLKLQARFNQSIIKRIVSINEYKRQIRDYRLNKERQPKIAIVTAFTEGYDSLKPPEFIDKRFEYIAYSDKPVNDMGIYDVRILPDFNLDGPRAIRYVKTHPHVLLKNYETVVWLDTSVMIVGDIYTIVREFADSKFAIGAGKHPLRNNIYEEYKACVERKKENVEIMKKQIDYYKESGFTHSDLTENTMLMFNLKHEKLEATLEAWWDQICSFSRRDQLSFNWALHKNNVKWFPITKPPEDIRNHPELVITAHHTEQKALEELIKRLGESSD